MKTPFDDDHDDDPPDDEREKQLQDSDGYMEQRAKQLIGDARERVQENKQELLVKAPVQMGDLSQRDRYVSVWATSVKQYLRAIEPLLRSDDLADADYYYRELEIVDKPVWPADDRQRVAQNPRYEGTPVRGPDGDTTHEIINWPELYEQSTPARGNSLLGHGFEPPEPKRVELKGLKSIMETEAILKEWRVPLNPQEPEFRQSVAMPKWHTPLKKEWLEKAVSEANQFLNDNGLGIPTDSGRDFNNYSE